MCGGIEDINKEKQLDFKETEEKGYVCIHKHDIINARLCC